MRRALLLIPGFVVAFTGRAGADPIAARASWEGGIDYFVTGAPLAVDGPDADGTMVDMFLEPNSVTVAAGDIPATATVVAAYLYWAGTIPDQMECALAPALTDDTVTLTVPGGVGTPTTAEACYCAAGAGSYDIQACRADITSRVSTSGMIGTYTVTGFTAQIGNGATDNASFALVLVFDDPDTLGQRRVALYDGVEELYMGTRVITLAGLDVDDPAIGDLTWYTLDGDVGGVGAESVTVTGIPGGASAALADAVNPVTNPMNHTINTVSPDLTDSIGMDLDRLDISAALASTDTAVDMTYSAGGDKYWVVFNVVGINVYKPFISNKSTKAWTLQTDADASGGPTPGDTIRYTITLKNVGTAPATVAVADNIPVAAESWVLVNAGGGIDASTATALVVTDIIVPPDDATVDVVFDMVLGAASGGTTVANTAFFNALPDGNTGAVTAPPLLVGNGAADAGPITPDAAPAMPDAADGTADAAPGVADASPGAQDAGPGAVDAGAGAVDAAVGQDGQVIDTGDAGGDNGGHPNACNCRVGDSSGAGRDEAALGGLLLGGLLAVLLAGVTRRRRRER